MSWQLLVSIGTVAFTAGLVFSLGVPVVYLGSQAGKRHREHSGRAPAESQTPRTGYWPQMRPLTLGMAALALIGAVMFVLGRALP
jgi:hypothetical protein